ncbi:uncharacterized protein LOC118647369 [Monomorium pharaonis]|uniref:uncharacterized protein LOC118647369 n=1 Tax=Monomorium pharaonis TaxID=307658 RepID=UPI00174782F9|nr:uncharacterized protein LOC118647369 [Monomorium pharaonis]
MFLSSNFQGKPRKKQKEETWQLFRAKNFQTLMYPCFFFCRILGIFPYKINISFDNTTFEISKPCYILSIVTISVCNTFTLIMLYIFIWCRTCFIEPFYVIKYPAMLMNCCIFMFSSILITTTFILNDSRIRLLQAILKISSRLPSKSYQKLSKIIHAKDIISFLLAWLILIYNLDINNINYVLIFSYVIYIYLVTFQINMLYMNCVCILKECFKEINDNLANMQECIANNKSHVSALMYHKQKTQFLTMKLKALQKQHLEISDTIHMLNMIFSIQLVATIVVTFSGITFCLYFYILYILESQHFLTTDTSKSVSYESFLFLILYYVIVMVLIVWACETGKNEALQINTSIHDVFNSTTDKQMKNELQLFSLQVFHCNNTFDAKSLTLDTKLLTKMVGSIATYVIILFQFVHMSYFCEEKAANNITKI